MNIAPISYNNQVFQCKNGKSITKGLKKFCERIVDNIERSATNVAKARIGMMYPFKDIGKYTRKIH